MNAIRARVSFALAAMRYWTWVFPRARGQLGGLRRRARSIPDPALRELALAALAKRGNMEGAAAFAAFVPARHRGSATDALVRFQALYNHLDTLVERRIPEPAEHSALHDALAWDAAATGSDDGYLAELVRDCRAALLALPRWEQFAPLARTAAGRIERFQILPESALERWARAATPAGSGLEWWELAGAAGSSLLIHAAIAAAAAAGADGDGSRASLELERAYFPWTGALHSLLDSLVDVREDAREGQLSLVGHYDSAEQARARIVWLAGASREAVAALPRGEAHALLLAAMVAYYLSELDPRQAGALHEALRPLLGWPLGAALLVFRARGLAARARPAPGAARSFVSRLAVGPGAGRTPEPEDA
jgi:Protein of unknown function (DUF2600)